MPPRDADFRSPRFSPHGPRPPARGPRADAGAPPRTPRPPLTQQVTTLWQYPSQHYDAWVDADGAIQNTRRRRGGGGGGGAFAMQGSKDYEGATPSWVIWNLLMRYTRRGDTILDPMCGSGTTLDVCADLERAGLGFDLNPQRPEIKVADARKLPLRDASVDFAFVDPPYSTHINYSNDPRCIGKLDAAGDDGGAAYYESMARVLAEMSRALKPGAHAAVYVSDSWRRTQRAKRDVFMPIGFNLFGLMCETLEPVDIIAVVRHNEKLERGNFRKAAEESNFFLRGFNYLLIAKKT
ncbi:hypothetical protein BH11PLA1_BH11PLA1_02570 [soil metagenome]